MDPSYNFWANYPPLMAVAHGSRDPLASASISLLMDMVRNKKPGLRVMATYLALCGPSFVESAGRISPDSVVVPLLMSRGYHLYHDIEDVCKSWSCKVTGVLGPDEMLTDVIVNRLEQGGIPHDTPIILAAAGSLDKDGRSGIESAATSLERKLNVMVVPALVCETSPSLAHVVANLTKKSNRRIAIASYLLSPGRCYAKIKEVNADWITAPVGPDGLVADLILKRYDEVVFRHQSTVGSASL